MNKNQKINLLFYILLGCYFLVIAFNLFFNFISFDKLFCIICLSFSIYLFFKFSAYNSDSSLFLGTFLIFTGIFYYISIISNFNLFQTLTLIFLAFILSIFILFVQYKSLKCLYVFLCGLLLFFPIIFFSFNVISLNFFFIFLFSCVIMDVTLYFLFI